MLLEVKHELAGSKRKAGAFADRLSVKTGIPSSYLSQQESGVKDLGLEDMLICENELSMALYWPDAMPLDSKVAVFQAMMSLAERFPLVAVLDFAKRTLTNRREKNPVLMVQVYARASAKPPEPLYPPGVED